MGMKFRPGLLKNDMYQVFLFQCPAFLPVSFFSHSWFVVNKKGEISRWEVGFGGHQSEIGWEHLDINNWPPFTGTPMFFGFPGKHQPLWKGKLRTYVEGGDESSLAYRMAEFISNSKATYSYRKEYHATAGPNSNTYVQWVLDAFPEFKAKLPFSAIGRSFPTKPKS